MDLLLQYGSCNPYSLPYTAAGAHPVPAACTQKPCAGLSWEPRKLNNSCEHSAIRQRRTDGWPSLIVSSFAWSGFANTTALNKSHKSRGILLRLPTIKSTKQVLVGCLSVCLRDSSWGNTVIFICFPGEYTCTHSLTECWIVNIYIYAEAEGAFLQSHQKTFICLYQLTVLII